MIRRKMLRFEDRMNVENCSAEKRKQFVEARGKIFVKLLICLVRCATVHRQEENPWGMAPLVRCSGNIYYQVG
jgi:hypothetical protein